MRLAPDDRRRYARQLALAEIGEDGQARILASRVALDEGADAGARAVAGAYLTRAGVSLVDAGDDAGARASVPAPDAVVALAGDAMLLEAARSLAGAVSAVEALKDILGLEACGAEALDLPCLGPETHVGRGRP